MTFNGICAVKTNSLFCSRLFFFEVKRFLSDIIKKNPRKDLVA
jgi:hypothetical protein